MNDHEINVIKKLLQLSSENNVAETMSILRQLKRELNTLNDKDFLNNLGVICSRIDQHEMSYSFLSRAISVAPNFAEAHFNLGFLWQKQNKTDDALRSFEKAIFVRPTYAEAFTHIAEILKQQGKISDAITHLRKALFADPQNIRAKNNLAVLLQESGESKQALLLFEELAKDHRNPLVLNNLSAAYLTESMPEKALDIVEQALSLEPSNPAIIKNYVRILIRFRKNVPQSVVIKMLQPLIETKDPEAIELMVSIFLVSTRFVDGIDFIKQLDISIETLNFLSASLHRSLGDINAAQNCYAKIDVRKVTKENLKFLTELVFTSDLSRASLFERNDLRKKIADTLYYKKISDYHFDSFRLRKKNQKIRIGYVSGDFRQHSASKVFGCLLVYFNKELFEVACYSTTNDDFNDQYTQLFKKNVSLWRNISRLDDDAACNLIRQDQIDILIDLSAYSAGGRLGIFANRAAPVQATGWGYVGGTGIAAVDYFFADAYTVLEHEKKLFSEKIYYLPSIVSFSYIENIPPVAESPLQKNGFVTFGSFNRLAKLSDYVLQNWKLVFNKFDRCKLIIKSHELDDEKVIYHLQQRLLKNGLDPNRIQLIGRTSWYEHLSEFGQVDICLDSYPHSGGVTTLESLLMGVPVMTLTSESVVGRLSASINANLGLNGWIADGIDEYLKKLEKNVLELHKSVEFRKSLRKKLLDSLICDGKQYTSIVEGAYSAIMQQCGYRE